jgi:LacI family transcriptional regulator
VDYGGRTTADRRPVTLHDVAREAGVSYATASRALNGSARTVRAENLTRVRAAAAKLGYAPHLSAQAIARGSTSTVALVVSDIDDPYFSSIAGGVIEAAEAEGLIVTMAVADRSPDLELRIVRTLRGHRPRGIIVVGSRVDGGDTRDALVGELGAYRAVGGRIAIISQDDLPFPTLAVDDHGGGRKLATALVKRGYQRFAVIHGGDTVRTSRDRRTGFEEGLRRAGLSAIRHVAADLTREGGVAGMRTLLAEGLQAIDAVFAVNDMMAIGAMTALRDAGLVPGRDLAVAGFDDIGAAVDVAPALTTVAVPLRELGLRALNLALRGDDPGGATVATEVMLRDSTPQR